MGQGVSVDVDVHSTLMVHVGDKCIPFEFTFSKDNITMDDVANGILGNEKVRGFLEKTYAQNFESIEELGKLKVRVKDHKNGGYKLKSLGKLAKQAAKDILELSEDGQPMLCFTEDCC
jgi:hypothetical protein